MQTNSRRALQRLGVGAGVVIIGLLLADSVSARTDQAEIDWLKERSMLLNAMALTAEIEGTGVQWLHAYGEARPEDFLEQASAWFAAYPEAIIGRPDTPVLETLGDPELLRLLSEIGIDAIHTGPMKRAGSVVDRSYRPTIDGYFDRIESAIDPAFGDVVAYRSMVRGARANGIAIIGDLIPGHTGKGPDFRLAERNVSGFPGVFSMVAIDPEDWSLLPSVPAGKDSVNLPIETVTRLMEKQYIVGPLEFVVFKRPGIKETSWSATDVVEGIDGVQRRWVYLHFFKEGQPSLNWLDPGFGAQRLIAGDALQSLRTLGVTALRLDATMFLGMERRFDGRRGWVGDHPLSAHATATVAMLTRKFGGYSFQETNTSLATLRQTLATGPELAYDFTTRPGWIYALVTGDAGPLRLLLRQLLENGVRPMRLVHGVQNHDELMLEATHLALNGDTTFAHETETATGRELFKRIPQETLAATTGPKRSYNEGFAMSPGVCSTVAGLAAAALGVERLDAITPELTVRIRQLHLAAAAFNALIPGALVLSGWDLVGALPVPRDKVAERMADNDCRWLNRGAYDLLAANPTAEASPAGLPRAVSLYGSLPEQRRSPDSFASRLKDMLAVRRATDLQNGRMIAVPEVPNEGLVVSVHELPGGGNGGGTASHAVTAVNFGRTAIEDRVDLGGLAVAEARRVFSTVAGTLDERLDGGDGAGGSMMTSIPIRLAPFEASVILVREP
jgi:trehalose synthase